MRWNRTSRTGPHRSKRAARPSVIVIPFALAVACFVGFLRRRPAVPAAVVVCVGFVSGLGLIQSGTTESLGPSASLASAVKLDGRVPIAPVALTVGRSTDDDALSEGSLSNGTAGDDAGALVTMAAPDRLRPPGEPGLRALPVDTVVHIEKGATLMQILVDAGIERTEAHDAVNALRSVYDPRRLRVGQAITLIQLAELATGSPGELVGVRLDKSFDREAGIGRLADGSFGSYEIEKKLESRPARGKGIIRSSLFGDGVDSGIPAPVMIEMIQLFSYDVDFQREIHEGDGFDLLFERMVAHDGTVVHDGAIRFGELTLGGKPIRLYRYEKRNGDVDYFDPNGQSARKALLRTPIDGARISSGYGLRRHPILGYSKMHRGVDFAAPRGTPIRAAGNGSIDYAGGRGSYGNYIRIQHNSSIATAYAHMNRLAGGMTKGTRVKQGQIIGYVGTTGRSTGPHLHYEVLRDDRQIDPKDLKLPSGEQLRGAELERFKRSRDAIDRERQTIPVPSQIARRD